jgi:acetyl esterase
MKAGTERSPIGGKARFDRFLSRTASGCVDCSFHALSLLSEPLLQYQQRRLERTRNVAYQPGGGKERTLDVWRSKQATSTLPVLLYVHGGAFKSLSKDTHWLMAMRFAQAGFLVFSINYRLAPKNPFPAGLQDVCTAYGWVLENAARFGGDPSRLLLAGESAGGNLCASLALLLCKKQPEPWAEHAFSLGQVPRAVLPACGIFAVSDSARFRREHGRGRFDDAVLQFIEKTYLPNESGIPALANPLYGLEEEQPMDRPLPPFFIPVGGSDPLLSDSERLHLALKRRKVQTDLRIYPRQGHAFHVFLWREPARQCWRDMFSFAQRYAF